MGKAKVLRRQKKRLSHWLSLVEKEVKFSITESPQIYHSLWQTDYVAILAKTPSGLFPLVSQFRPAVEQYTWELPAGLRDRDENPRKTCYRELLEETGLRAKKIRHLGTFCADTGRLNNKQHAYFVETEEPNARFISEPGIEVKYVTWDQLVKMVSRGELSPWLHAAVVLLYKLKKDSEKS